MSDVYIKVPLIGNPDTDSLIVVDDYGDVTYLTQYVENDFDTICLTAAQRTELAYLLVTGNPMPRDKS